LISILYFSEIQSIYFLIPFFSCITNSIVLRRTRIHILIVDTFLVCVIAFISYHKYKFSISKFFSPGATDFDKVLTRSLPGIHIIIIKVPVTVTVTVTVTG